MLMLCWNVFLFMNRSMCPSIYGHEVNTKSLMYMLKFNLFPSITYMIVLCIGFVVGQSRFNSWFVWRQSEVSEWQGRSVFQFLKTINMNICIFKFVIFIYLLLNEKYLLLIWFICRIAFLLEVIPIYLWWGIQA